MVEWETPKDTVPDFEIFDLSTGLFNNPNYFISSSLWEFIRDNHLDFSSGNHVIQRINTSCGDFDQNFFVCDTWFSDFCNVQCDIVLVIGSVLCYFHCLLFSILCCIWQRYKSSLFKTDLHANQFRFCLASL